MCLCLLWTNFLYLFGLLLIRFLIAQVFSFSFVFTGMKPIEDPLEEMDDDLLSLLNFSSATPVSESWYMGSTSNSASSGMNGASEVNVSLDIQQNASTLASPVNTSAAAPDDEVKRSLPPCFWNNMPGIC